MGQVDSVLHGRVRVVRLAGGGANAITREMAEELESLALGVGPETGCVLIVGGFGGAFCGGSHIGELGQLREAGQGPAPLLETEARAFDAIASLDVPTIASVEGAAAGGGLELALCCDLILTAETARFSLPEVKLGVFPALGGTVRLQRRIGEGRAMHLLLTGDEIDGTTAAAWGLANRALPQVGLYRTARQLADRLAAGPMAAMAGIKRSVRQTRAMTEDDALRAALTVAISHSDSPEVAEGFRAFEAGEDPNFGSLSASQSHAPTSLGERRRLGATFR